MIWYIASLGSDITDAVAEVSEALRYPVLILALFAAVVDIYELGRLTVEVIMRRQKDTDNFDAVARQAQATAQAGDVGGAQALLKSQAHGERLENAYIRTLLSPTALEAERAAVDYDIYVSKRLDRVRLLTRAGPALGLMGTLIPLAPALAALGRGDAKVLTDELQTAFAITVVGVGVGLLAFAIALVHERLYSRDLANIDYLRQLRGDATIVVQSAAPALATTTVTPPETIASAGVQATGATQVAPASTAPASTAPATPAPASPAPAAPTPAAPGAAPQGFPPAPQAPTAAPTIQQPAAAPQKKKKFGLKKKEKPGAAAPATGFPPAPAGMPPAAPPAPQAPQGPPPGVPADKSPQIPTTPKPGDDKPDDGDKSSSIPTPPPNQ